MTSSGTPSTTKETLSNVNVTAALDVEGNVPLKSVQIDGLVCTLLNKIYVIGFYNL